MNVIKVVDSTYQYVRYNIYYNSNNYSYNRRSQKIITASNIHNEGIQTQELMTNASYLDWM